MITAVTAPLTAITTISNVDNLFVSVYVIRDAVSTVVGVRFSVSVPDALDGLVTFCDLVIEAGGTVVSLVPTLGVW